MDHRTLLLLRAARETGIIDAVTTDASTVAAVVAETGVTERAARVAIDALVPEGFLTHVDGAGYEPTNRMLGFLTTTDLRSIGRTPHELDVADALAGLPARMQRDELPDLPDDFTVHELGARRAEPEAAIRARVTAALRDAPDADSVLVFGDGPGEHARELAARGHTVTLVETPAVVEHVAPPLEHEPIDLVARAVDDPLPEGFDLLVAPRAFRTRGPDENQRFVDRAHDALVSGGVAVFIDTFRDTAGNPASLAAELLATTEAGQLYDRDVAAGWLEAAGFEVLRSERVPGTDDGAVVGRVDEGGEARH